ncbi:hypothetical protein F4825DRAFT_322152 [Nemania diffusa]|nr:hypothetical protein F4825DRAFT_322152 [Nemania diffusa]
MDGSLGAAGRAPGLAPPVSGAALFGREMERRMRLCRRGTLSTGCSEIDDALLLGGGFERGCVVGVSAEEVDFGVLLGLQTIARALVFEGSLNEGRSQSRSSSSSSSSSSKQRAAIITTLPVTAILPTLRDAIRFQAQIKHGPQSPNVDAEVRRSLEAISVSRIFDIEGLWEVLRELGESQAETSFRHNHNEDTSGELERNSEDAMRGAANEEMEESTEAGAEQADTDLTDPTDPTTNLIPRRSPSPETVAPLPRPATQLPPLRIGNENRRLVVRKAEILDSEDEEPLSSSPLSSPPPSTIAPGSASPAEEPAQSPADPEPHHTPSLDPEPEAQPQKSDSPRSTPPENPPPPVPDIILVTHFSSLLTTLFTHADKTSAHTNLQLLSSHLRHLATSSADPLIMLLNTTTSPAVGPSTSTSITAPRPFPAPDPHPIPPPPEVVHHRPLDATLRSVFHPAPHSHGHGARRNKPSFGATFAQLLDLHLLCTSLPRTRDDAETAVALGVGDVRRAWVVEVLLDEGGVWLWGEAGVAGRGGGGDGGGEGESGRPPRRVNREQRWAAVDVRDGVRIVNAFAATGGGGGGGSRGPVRVVGGFGGSRV